MAERVLGRPTGSITLTLTNGANGMRVNSINASWGRCRAYNHIGNTFSSASNQPRGQAFTAFGSYGIYRGNLGFQLPSNLTRCDETPILYLYGDNAGLVDPIYITSNSYALFNSTVPLYDPGGDRSDEVQLAQSASLQASGLYSAKAGGLASGQYNAITLNELARKHVSEREFWILTMIDAQYDYANVAPSSSSGFSADGPADANPPYIILRKPWFINDKGDEVASSDDYIIQASTVNGNQRNRNVAQLPFGTAVKGPMNLRGRNKTYEVTRS